MLTEFLSHILFVNGHELWDEKAKCEICVDVLLCSFTLIAFLSSAKSVARKAKMSLVFCIWGGTGEWSSRKDLCPIHTLIRLIRLPQYFLPPPCEGKFDLVPADFQCNAANMGAMSMGLVLLMAAEIGREAGKTLFGAT